MAIILNLLLRRGRDPLIYVDSSSFLLSTSVGWGVKVLGMMLYEGLKERDWWFLDKENVEFFCVRIAEQRFYALSSFLDV